MTSSVVIDDNDPAVQYSEGWTLDQTYPFAMGLTRHGAPAGSELTATVKFHGTSITVFGIIQGPGEDHSNYTMPGAGFVLDGGTSGVFHGYQLSSLVDTIYNQTLFSQDALPLQDHELAITRVQGNTPIILWLDYFLVAGQPSSSSTSNSVTVVLQPGTSSTSTFISSRAPPRSSATNPISSSTSVTLPLSATSSRSLAPTTVPNVSSVTTSVAPPFSVTFSGFTSTLVVISTPSSTESGRMSTSTTPVATAAPSRPTHMQAIIGGSVGASLLVILAAVLVCLLQRRRRRTQRDDTLSRVDAYRTGSLPGRTRLSEMQPPSPTKSRIRPLSSAAGTIHTSVLPEAPSVSRTSPVLLDKNNQDHSLSSQPGQLSPTRAWEAHVHSVGMPNSCARVELPTTTEIPSTALISDTSSSFLLNAPFVLPTEIGHALSYAPPEVQSNVISLFRSLFLRRGTTAEPQNRVPGEADRQVHAEVDSGLRMYNDAYVPPPEYTTH